jgi:hypothetical protein
VALVAVGIGDQNLAYRAFKVAISNDANHAESFCNLGILEVHKRMFHKVILKNCDLFFTDHFTSHCRSLFSSFFAQSTIPVCLGKVIVSRCGEARAAYVRAVVQHGDPGIENGRLPGSLRQG